MTISNSVKKLYIKSIPKGLEIGAMIGVAVWAVLFVTLHFGLMQPMLERIVV
ncbi:MAG TPA: hypothetical protein VHA09_04140 [Nitrososphaera sp.]|nr:hypothetical protein [Nitrososphaera sp.]